MAHFSIKVLFIGPISRIIVPIMQHYAVYHAIMSRIMPHNSPNNVHKLVLLGPFGPSQHMLTHIIAPIMPHNTAHYCIMQPHIAVHSGHICATCCINTCPKHNNSRIKPHSYAIFFRTLDIKLFLWAILTAIFTALSRLSAALPAIFPCLASHYCPI